MQELMKNFLKYNNQCVKGHECKLSVCVMVLGL